MYLKDFQFVSPRAEEGFLNSIKRTVYNSFYPFRVLSAHGLQKVEFEPITIFYGGNGSGKTTALNVIAEKLHIRRDSLYNRSSFYEDYLSFCQYTTWKAIPQISRIITSDDVFDYMLDMRSLNQGIDVKREEVFEEYLDAKYSDFKFRTMEDYSRLKKVNQTRRVTQSKYTKQNLMANVPEKSNGENAYLYFEEKIQQNGLYLLDEPENSLSSKRQIELCRFIEESTRFFGCQFVIATHSPFILALKGAKIYDLDVDPVAVKKWTELENVRTYFDFFMEHRKEFGINGFATTTFHP